MISFNDFFSAGPVRTASGGAAAPGPFLNGQQASAFRSPVLTNADNRPYLWTQDNSPIYGSPNGAGQSPLYQGRKSPRNLIQYSYTDS